MCKTYFKACMPGLVNSSNIKLGITFEFYFLSFSQNFEKYPCNIISHIIKKYPLFDCIIFVPEIAA